MGTYDQISSMSGLSGKVADEHLCSTHHFKSVSIFVMHFCGGIKATCRLYRCAFTSKDIQDRLTQCEWVYSGDPLRLSSLSSFKLHSRSSPSGGSDLAQTAAH